MIIYLGADHRGFELKEHLALFLAAKGYEVMDLGAAQKNEEDDYPDYAHKVTEKVALAAEQARGVLVCGSGTGMAIAANRNSGVRAGLAFSADQVFASREEDDINILCLGADYTAPDAAEKFLTVFLNTPFSGLDRHRRRIEKMLNG